MEEFIEALKEEAINAPMLAVMYAIIVVILLMVLADFLGSSVSVSVSECAIPVIIGIATIRERRESLAETFESLLNQADRVLIYPNDYDPMVDRWDKVAFRSNKLGDIGDIGKFAAIWMPVFNRPDEYYCFVCDDDLIYPPDYVAKTIAAIERHDRKAVVGYHGKLYFGPVSSYYGDLQNHVDNWGAHNHRCLDEVVGPRDWRVTIIGTGCAAWHSSLFEENPLSMDDFKHPNMADIWFSKKCNDLGIPRYVIPHDAGWIRHSDKVDAARDTIAARYRNDDAVQTAVFNSVYWEV